MKKFLAIVLLSFGMTARAGVSVEFYGSTNCQSRLFAFDFTGNGQQDYNVCSLIVLNQNRPSSNQSVASVRIGGDICHNLTPSVVTLDSLCVRLVNSVANGFRLENDR